MDSLVSIQPLSTSEQARQCATIMASSEPWLTLGRNFDAALEIFSDKSREVYVHTDHSGVAAFVIIEMAGAFRGYIRTVAVRADRRGNGLGTRILEFAEQRIFRDSPNVFMCVSSFNDRARRLYEKLGYVTIGEIPDYIVRGHSEFLLRKTTGPLSTFKKKECKNQR